MFGKIISFNESHIVVENLKELADTNFIGYHIVFDDNNNKVVGEVTGIDTKTITISLIGEIHNGTFTNGVIKKPGVNSTARVIYKSELETILGNQNYQTRNAILFGRSPIYKDFVITANLDNFFANHFAIIGNTGSGKSCGLTRLLQNIFYANPNEAPKNAHICLFDAYGEYYNTFNAMDQTPGLHFKKYTTQINDIDPSSVLRFPAYLLEVDDLAILLGATDPAQIPVLSKALELVRIFTSTSPKAEEYKNNIIAKNLLDILSSGKSSTQMRDQVISLLTTYNTPSLNLDSKIHQPGYDRTFRQCLLIDDQGKINAIKLVVDFLQKFTQVSIEQEIFLDTPYTLSDLYYALEFALINEGSFVAESIFEKTNILKSRLQTIINSSQAEFFKYDGFVSRDEFVEKFFTADPFTETAQLVDINLSYLDDKFAKCITKIFSKLFFNYTTSLEDRGSFSIHILLEEAHRYVQNDTDINLIGYNIFDRITKEGRKYGTILGFITQRPAELSKTVLSQCSNFIVFKLFYPEDLNIVRGISSNVTDETIEKIKTLRPGMGLVFGSAFKVPLLAEFELPNPLPVSTSLMISDIWYR